MRIINLIAENVLRLSAVSISPSGNVVQITGPNGAGKSSILNAIFLALAGKNAIPEDPVHHGAEAASVRLDLGKGATVEYIVRRVIQPDGETVLTVKSPKGANYPSPQKILNDLLGAIAFDPLEFARAKPKEKRAQLGRMLGLDEQLDTLDTANRVDFDNRTVLSRDVKALNGKIGDEIPAECEPVDLSEAFTLLQKAELNNRSVEEEKTQRALMEKERHALRDRAETLETQADELIAEVDRLNAAAGRITDRLAMPAQYAPVDAEPIRASIMNAEPINARFRERQHTLELIAQRDALEQNVAALTQALKEREAVKAAMIAGALLPIPGLGLTADNVTYNGAVFENASSAEQLRVSAAIAMAVNPELRVMLIRDGSLLDTVSMQALEDMANEFDFQVWIERVDESGEVGVVIRDGSVASVHPSTVEHMAAVHEKNRGARRGARNVFTVRGTVDAAH